MRTSDVPCSMRSSSSTDRSWNKWVKQGKMSPEVTNTETWSYNDSGLISVKKGLKSAPALIWKPPKSYQANYRVGECCRSEQIIQIFVKIRKKNRNLVLWMEVWAKLVSSRDPLKFLGLHDNQSVVYNSSTP